MAFDGFVTHGIAAELSELLSGGKIDKIYQPEKDEIILSVRTREGGFRVLLSAATSSPRVHLTQQTRENPLTAPLFCMILRKHLSGGKIKAIYQVGFDRIIRFDIECYTEMGDLTEKSLIIEIMGKHSNIIFIQNDNKIIDCIKHIDFTTSQKRQVLPGLLYELPPAQEKADPRDINEEFLSKRLGEYMADSPLDKALVSEFLGMSPLLAREIVYSFAKSTSAILKNVDISTFSKHTVSTIKGILSASAGGCVVLDSSSEKPIAFSSAYLTQYGELGKVKVFESLSEAVEKFFYDRSMHDRLSQRAASTIKVISNNIERCNKKIELHNENIRKAENRDKYKKFGDLLIANLYQIQSSAQSVTVNDFFSGNNEKIEIQLKPELTPSQNAQRYYKLYNKAKATEEHSKAQLLEAKSEKLYLESVLDAANRVLTYSDITDIREELAEQGYISGAILKKKKKIAKSKPIEYTSSDGYTILVGRNNKQNDELTMKMAYSTDLWLHTKNIPGSHVIIRTGGSDQVPDNTLLEAAAIAVYHSKAQNGSGIGVDYTQVKNIRKPNGSKPGFVIYETNYTVYVTPDKKVIENLRKDI